MKKTLMVLGHLHADTKRWSKDRCQTATVVTVDKHVSESNFAGGSPSVAHLQAEDHSYDIGIRLNCNIYIGRYESATDYLPAAFSPNHAGRRAASETRYVWQPARDGDREVKMGIVGHSRLKEKGCVTN